MTESVKRLLHDIFLVDVFKVLKLLNGRFLVRRRLGGSDLVNYERPQYLLG